MVLPETLEIQDGLYKKASAAVDNELRQHIGERFTLDDMCGWLNLQKTDKVKRDKVNQVLYYRVKHGNLEKSLISRPPLYRYIDNTIVHMNWRESKGAAHLTELRWPSGIDKSQFGFDGRVYIPEKGLIILAGVTNTGKSTFCRNLLWANMDAYKCIYFSSETSEDDFADYASRMSWADPVREDGSDKFELIWRIKDFRDLIDPDAINIIDWLNIYDNFYQIGEVLEGIKGKLKKGIAFVAIQKDPNKGLGVGGMWSEHNASLYLTMDFGRMTVLKAKKWYDWNPNGKTWGFNIVDHGTHFRDIRLQKKCGFCFNGKKNNMTCSICNGTGFVDDEVT